MSRTWHGLNHHVWVTRKKAVKERDNYTCVYCGEQLAPEDCTVDHVVPYRKGGSSKLCNLVTSCHTCNVKKGSVLPSLEVLKWVAPHTGYPDTLREVNIGYFLRKGYTVESVLKKESEDQKQR